MSITSLRNLYLFSVLCLAILWSSCRKDFDYQASRGNLTFSKDTIYLDTVFTTIGSSTYALKVYNTSKIDIEIPSITLENGLGSGYRMNVDGQAGKEFYNVPLFANDSLYIFIETTFDISTVSGNEFLYTDAILFDNANLQQKVSLVTLIKDAVFLYPKKNTDGSYQEITLDITEEGKPLKANGFILEESHLNFTNDKPYVIYGYAAVPENKSLVIDGGSRIHFHKNSGILVQKNSSLVINGRLSSNQELLENEVIFEGDRLEPEYDTLAGQWGTIWLHKESTNNVINHLTIKNATIGLLVNGTNSEENLNLSITNSQIYNSATHNLWCKTANVRGSNLVLGNAGGSSLYCNIGGSYSFTHVTIANYFAKGLRTSSALQIDNTNGSVSKNLNKADFVNCIIDGNYPSEVSFFTLNKDFLFNFSFSSSMLKIDPRLSNPKNWLYDFEDVVRYESVFLNEDASFVNREQNNFSINSTSFAIGKANLEGLNSAPQDILGVERAPDPAIGAYQYIGLAD